MKIKVNFKFDEKYLPPRCRKYRTRTVDGQAEVFVKETIKEKAPIACIVHDGWDFYADPMPDGHYPKKVYDVRLYDGQMYKRKLARDWVAKGKGYATVEQLAKHINWCANVKWSDDFEGRVKAAQEDADGFLIMDGEVWVKCGEPMYLVELLVSSNIITMETFPKTTTSTPKTATKRSRTVKKWLGAVVIQSLWTGFFNTSLSM